MPDLLREDRAMPVLSGTQATHPSRLYLSEGWFIWKMGQSKRPHATEESNLKLKLIIVMLHSKSPFFYNDIKKEMIYCHRYTDFLNAVMPKLLVVNTALDYPIFTLHSDQEAFSDDLRIISVTRGDRLDFRTNRPVLHDMVRKMNRMKINCLTLLDDSRCN